MDWGTLVAIIVAAIFGITAIVLTLRLGRKKKPVWASVTNEIIGLDTNAPAELKLSFNDKPVRDAYRTIFIFFNKGREPIRENDVVEDIAIHFKGADILQQPVILKPSKEAIKFSAKQIVKGEDNAMKFGFRYLDHNDGAVVEVLHTKPQAITCSGDIIGTDRIRYIGRFFAWHPPRFLSISYGCLVVLSPFLIYYFFKFLITSFPSTPGSNTLPLIILFTVFMLMGLIRVWSDVPGFYRYAKFPKWSNVGKKTSADDFHFIKVR